MLPCALGSLISYVKLFELLRRPALSTILFWMRLFRGASAPLLDVITGITVVMVVELFETGSSCGGGGPLDCFELIVMGMECCDEVLDAGDDDADDDE